MLEMNQFDFAAKELAIPKAWELAGRKFCDFSRHEKHNCYEA